MKRKSGKRIHLENPKRTANRREKGNRNPSQKNTLNFVPQEKETQTDRKRFELPPIFPKFAITISLQHYRSPSLTQLVLSRAVTRVGAILRLFLSPPDCSGAASATPPLPEVSVASDLAGEVGASSLLPRTLPALLPPPSRGVWGGVVNGMPVAVAATLGSAPRVGVGLFIVFDVMVATEDEDDDRAGELGGRDEYGAGDNGGMEVGIILPIGMEAGNVGVGMEVGVGVPVVC
jgi:hypothetical protein